MVAEAGVAAEDRLVAAVVSAIRFASCASCRFFARAVALAGPAS
jgi:hypothetical protein